MPDYGTKDIRNLALAGHGDSGKTTLVEVILNKCGATNRVGIVEDGTTVSDSDPQEKARGMSIDSAVVHVNHKGRELNIIDTPGYPEFIGQVVTSLPAVETAVLAISASAGIQLNTRRTWDLAKELGLARVVLITKMDGENVDFDALLGQIQDTFGKECAPVMLPVGQSRDFSGVLSLMDPPASPPDGVIGDIDEMRNALVETILESDEDVLERYLMEEQIAPEEIASLFGKAVAAGMVVPVLCCAARADKGVDEVLDFLADVLPSPIEGLSRVANDPKSDEGATIELKPEAGGPLCAQVFKTITDPFVGKLCYFRVFSGSMEGEFSFVPSSTGKSQRVAQLLRPMGQEQEQVERCVPGDIMAFAKVEELRTFDTLYSPKRPAVLSAPALPTPMVSLAVEPKSRGDEQKIGSSLAKLADEDVAFQISRDPQTGETVVTGMSSLHVDIMLARLKERFQVEVNTKQPTIPYKETIAVASDTSYRHKKQTGGRGQFGEVWIRLIPLERGAGFEFDNQVVGGVIPHQFIPAVQKGIVNTMARGVLAGFPVTDLKVELYDGKHHSVDSSEAAFKMAGSKAFRDGFMKGKPVLLEPIVDMEVIVPNQFFGDISGHLSSHRGRIQGGDAMGNMQVIRAEVPMAEVTNYATELKSMTGGQGSYGLEFSHYDIVPSNITQEIIAKAKRPKDEDEE